MKPKQCYIILSMLLISRVIWAQDSLHFTNHQVLAAMVSEINIDYIKYYRYDNLKGPQYTINKEEISFIKFANGVVDTIKVTKKTVVTNNTTVTNEDKKLHIDERSRIMYNYHIMNNRELKSFLENVPQKNAKDALLKDFLQMKHYNRNQTIFNYSSIGFSIVGTLGLMTFSSTKRSRNKYTSTPSILLISGLTGFLTSQLLSKLQRNKHYLMKELIVKKYNSL